jgi:hypothetical protein
MKLLIIPEEYYPSKKVYDKYLKVAEPYDWVFFHGLFSHVGSYAKASNPNKICFTYDDFKDIVYARVVGGHIHKQITYKNIDYINSFDRDRHGEEEDKGYFIYTYDVKKKKLINKIYIINEEAHKYITLMYKDIYILSTDELVNIISSKAKGVKSLRIKINKDDPITEEKLHTLLTISFDLSNVIIDKKDQTDSFNINSISVEKQKELEERKKEIEKYKDLTFEEITIRYAKERYNAIISGKDIARALEN